MNYIAGRQNLACTVFVPFACGNNCPFCTSLEMYKGYKQDYKYLASMLHNIKLANANKFISEFVLTGGEPFMNLDVLKILVDAMEKPVFINTSLPQVKNIDEVISFINTNDHVKGINISRHLNITYNVKVCDKSVIDCINKPVRINCIVTKDNLDDDLLDFINAWATPTRMINLRADYRTITTDNLKNCDEIAQWLREQYMFEYASSCLVCNSEFYSDNISTVVCYHRGLEHSAAIYGNLCYVNDVLIDIYGNVYKDWDMKEDEDFNKWFEDPYERKEIKLTVRRGVTPTKVREIRKACKAEELANTHLVDATDARMTDEDAAIISKVDGLYMFKNHVPTIKEKQEEQERENNAHDEKLINKFLKDYHLKHSFDSYRKVLVSADEYVISKERYNDCGGTYTANVYAPIKSLRGKDGYCKYYSGICKEIEFKTIAEVANVYLGLKQLNKKLWSPFINMPDISPAVQQYIDTLLTNTYKKFGTSVETDDNYIWTTECGGGCKKKYADSGCGGTRYIPSGCGSSGCGGGSIYDNGC